MISSHLGRWASRRLPTLFILGILAGCKTQQLPPYGGTMGYPQTPAFIGQAPSSPAFANVNAMNGNQMPANQAQLYPGSGQQPNVQANTLPPTRIGGQDWNRQGNPQATAQTNPGVMNQTGFQQTSFSPNQGSVNQQQPQQQALINPQPGWNPNQQQTRFNPVTNPAPTGAALSNQAMPSVPQANQVGVQAPMGWNTPQGNTNPNWRASGNPSQPIPPMNQLAQPAVFNAPSVNDNNSGMTNPYVNQSRIPDPLPPLNTNNGIQQTGGIILPPMEPLPSSNPAMSTPVSRPYNDRPLPTQSLIPPAPITPNLALPR
jgi:hypothetical protein